MAVFAVALALVAGTSCAKLQARDHLNKGVQAYKNAKYELAIDHFQKAVALDPTLINARLYLATAFAQQYIPGADTPDNNKNADAGHRPVQAGAASPILRTSTALRASRICTCR